MRILFAFPGHLKTVPMREFCVQALGDLGHEVHVFDFRKSTSERIVSRVGRWLGGSNLRTKPITNARFRRCLRETKPDLFLTLFGFDLTPQSLVAVRARRIPSACWWLNDPFQFERSLQRAGDYDFLFSNSERCVSDYRAQGIPNAHFLPAACHPPVHIKAPPVPQWQ